MSHITGFSMATVEKYLSINMIDSYYAVAVHTIIHKLSCRRYCRRYVDRYSSSDKMSVSEVKEKCHGTFSLFYFNLIRRLFLLRLNQNEPPQFCVSRVRLMCIKLVICDFNAVDLAEFFLQ